MVPTPMVYFKKYLYFDIIRTGDKLQVSGEAGQTEKYSCSLCQVKSIISHDLLAE